MGKNKIAKLNRLHSELLRRSLVVEASLVADLQGNLNKEAGIIDDAYKLIEDIKNNPEIIGSISLALKVLAVLGPLTGVGASAAPGLLAVSSAADLTTAALYARKGDWGNAVFSLISAIISLPSSQITQIYSLILSEKFVEFAIRFSRLSHDKAWLGAAYIAEFFKRSVPLLFEGFLSLIRKIGGKIQEFAPMIAEKAGKRKEDIISGLSSYLKGMESEITRVSGMVIPA